MSFIEKIVSFAQDRADRYGTHYIIFGILGITNFPIAYLYESIVMHTKEGLVIRSVATILCLGLLLKNRWPEKCKKYIGLYWYITFMISSPILTSYLALKNGLTLEWLMNFILSVTLSMLLLDIVAFLIIEVIGVLIGFCIFYILGNHLGDLPSYRDLWLFLYMLFFTVIVGILFSRSREIINSVKENHRLKSEVKNRTTELAEALAFKTEYLNSMSHEIRTPVHGFWNFSMILVDQWKLLSDQKKFEIAVQISKNAERLKTIVSNLLDISKHAASKWNVNPIKLNLSHIIADIIEEANTLYIASAEKKIDIQWDQTQNIELFADNELISQVIRNLLVNAIKFSSNNSTLYITFELMSLKDIRNKGFLILLPSHFDDVSNLIHFSLKDEGIGIPEEEILTIFDEFKQSSRTSINSGGTGLGLAICKKVISLHGGVIFAENNKDVRGATFHFIIPQTYFKGEVIPEYLGYLEESKQEYLSELSIEYLSDKVIVIIDDEERVVDAALLILEAEGYKVEAFTHGIQAIQYIRSNYHKIGVILLDLMMYELSGLDILTILMKDDRLKDIPVIIQSGVEDGDDLAKARDIGVKYFLTKPYSKDKILSALNLAVSQKSEN